jgi:HSP20 family protein
MFFATTAPALSRRQLYSPAGRSLERFLDEAVVATRQKSAAIEQDETSFTLSFDVPGIETKEGATRQYKSAYELPQDIDVSASVAKLENGVLTLKLVKVVPVNKVAELVIT